MAAVRPPTIADEHGVALLFTGHAQRFWPKPIDSRALVGRGSPRVANKTDGGIMQFSVSTRVS